MGLTVCWTSYTEQYKATLKYIKDRKYHQALNKLQKLVTQQLFELHKVNVTQTGEHGPVFLILVLMCRGLGYKMRTHIAKSLQTQCKTIQRAVKAYNAAAAMLNPPCPALDWSNISGFNLLEEFSPLQDTHNDICSKEWSKPTIRKAMKL
ncbi:hypothetical protein BC835DRAFT_1297049 [Cytidiella melzeri]|nr:hypothetical protein BC835DRAFT_1297049 [Cytidiella melzeri]